MLEVDGPMPRHGIQEVDKRPLQVPHGRLDKPDRSKLAVRFAEFARAG